MSPLKAYTGFFVTVHKLLQQIKEKIYSFYLASKCLFVK